MKVCSFCVVVVSLEVMGSELSLGVVRMCGVMLNWLWVVSSVFMLV